MKRLTASSGTKSKLAKPVQELIKMIFDVESMKKAMVEFEVRLFIYLFIYLFRGHELAREEPHSSNPVLFISSLLLCL